MTVRGPKTLHQRCPACAGWSSPGASTCARCGGALRAGVGNPPSRRSPSPKATLLVVLATVAGGVAWLLVRVASPGATSNAMWAAGLFEVERQSFEPLPEPTAPRPPETDGDGPARFLVDPNHPPESRQLASGLGTVEDLAYTRDGRFLITVGYGDFSVRVWDCRTEREIQGIRTHHRPHSVAVSPDGSRLFVSDVYGFLRSYAWHSSGRLSWERITALEGSLGRDVAIRPDGRLLATTVLRAEEGLELVILDAADPSVLRRVAASETLRRPEFSSFGPLARRWEHREHLHVVESRGR